MEIQEVTPDRAEEAANYLDNYYNEVRMPLTVDREKTYNQVVGTIFNDREQLLIAVENGSIIGIAWSYALEPFFSNDITVENLLVYVSKDKRGGMAGPRLLRHIKKWAKDIDAKMIKIGTISEINTLRTKNLFKKMGYREVGSHFISEL